jgi:hypothetical protein
MTNAGQRLERRVAPTIKISGSNRKKIPTITLIGLTVFLSVVANIRRPPMSAQAFEFRQLPYRRHGILERGARVFHHTGAALELIHGQAG